jgi:dynein heavy chain, axonemal
MTDPNVSLATFEIVDAFAETAADQFTEISGQASAEASLEVLLKKVENTWKEQDLTVIQHRDARDVYILGGTEEIQTLLDESFINISTILSSRYVGPIKTNVEDWKTKLDLFAQTLDEWLNCQQQWIYLSAIFSAPDIQRQLPHEAKLFTVVDKSWKQTMRQTHKMPLALIAMTQPGLLNTMKTNNALLEQITRCLEAYLEIKRVAFPRFYFLSNDELLEILAQTRNPHAVQPHLRKCFDAIAKLEFYGQTDSEGVRIETTDIKAMISPEGERIQLPLGLKARGAVEDWLGKVEDAMVLALKQVMKLAMRVYPNKDRSVWFKEYPNQVVLTVSQQQWAVKVHQILDNGDEDMVLSHMVKFEKELVQNLNTLAAIARSDISVLVRRVLCALITIDVHAKDTISAMIKEQVVKS